MSRFVLLSFAFMGWAFYEVSGGADFKPEPPARLAHAAASSQVAPEPETALATGATSTISNTSQATTHTTTSNSETTASIQSASLSSTVAFIPKTRRNTLLSLPIPTPGTTPFSIAPPTQATPTTHETLLSQASLATPTTDPVRVADIRSVRASRINMRNGPGTRYSVLAKLSRGATVEILQEPGNGWVKVKVVEGGRIGWTSAKLLQKQN